MTTQAPIDPAKPAAANGAAATAAETPVDKTLADKRAELAEIARRQKARMGERNGDRQARLAAEQQARDALQHARQLQAQWEALQAELADPLTFLHKKGITAEQIGQRIVDQGTPNEGVTKALNAARRAEEKAEAIIREGREREQRAQAQATQAQAIQRVHTAFDALKDECPLLGCQDGNGRVHEYMVTYQRALADPETRDYADQYTDAELLQATEARIRFDLESKLEHYDLDALEKLLTKRKGAGTLNGSKDAASAPQSNPGAKANGKTLNASITAGSASSWKPENFGKLSSKEQNRILVDAYKRGLLTG
jgi:hypothetical protein